MAEVAKELETSVAGAGHLQAHPARRPVIVVAVAQWLPRWRVDSGDLDVPKSFTR
jgi:hypothetical protein